MVLKKHVGFAAVEGTLSGCCVIWAEPVDFPQAEGTKRGKEVLKGTSTVMLGDNLASSGVAP